MDTESNDEYRIRFKKFILSKSLNKQITINFYQTNKKKKKRVLSIDIVSLSRTLGTSPTPFTFVRPLLCTQLFFKKKK